jgi:hypothetical protein
MKINTITIFENLLGVILAVFILFKIVPAEPVRRDLNHPVLIILYLVFTVILFATLNPILGFLFLIYGYLLIAEGKQERRNHQLHKMNPEQEVDLEELVIQSSEFSRIKNKNEDSTSTVNPILEKIKI